MDAETVFQFLGLVACIAASAFFSFRGGKLPAVILLAGFVLRLQAAHYMTFANTEKAVECYFKVGEHYSCLPVGYKISVHSGQAGLYLVALAVVIIALRWRRPENPGS